MEPRTLQDVADYCRWSIMGYRDGKPGTPDDIMERLDRLERMDRANLKRINELERGEFHGAGNDRD